MSSGEGQKPLVYQNRKLPDVGDELQKMVESVFTVVWPDSEELEAKRNQVQGMIVCGGKADSALLKQFPALKVVSNHGVGCDHIDISWDPVQQAEETR